MLEKNLSGEMALLYAARFDRAVLIADVLITSADKARAYLDEMPADTRARVLVTVRIAAPREGVEIEAA